jgi:hypothetical protein
MALCPVLYAQLLVVVLIKLYLHIILKMIIVIVYRPALQEKYFSFVSKNKQKNETSLKSEKYSTVSDLYV